MIEYMELVLPPTEVFPYTDTWYTKEVDPEVFRFGIH